MFWNINLFVFLLIKWARSDDQISAPPNPCPDIFNYYYDSDGKVFGEIKVPNDGSKVFKINLNASYVGMFDETTRPKLRLDLTTPTNEILNARELIYRLSLNIQNVLPRITQIKFNERVYCSGPSAPLTSAGVSNLWVFKENRIQTFSYYPNEPTMIIQPLKSTIPPFIPPRTTTPYPWVTRIEEIYEIPKRDSLSKPQNEAECGVSERTVNLITDGVNVTANEFPWLVALYEWKDANYQFRCTANLIDRSHVVTVGSCLVFYKSYLVKPENILLVFGSSDLNRWASKSDMTVREVTEVTVNPDYTQYSAHGDVAVLTLKEPIEYSRTVKPVCLWKGTTNIEQIVGRYGTVAGWGKDDHQMKFLSEAKKLEMPVVSQAICEKSNDEFSKLVSDKTFCAGDRNSKGPCTGDVGSPFMLKINGKWYLRGLVSQAIFDRRTFYCKLDEYIAFSDVAKYSSWLSRVLNDK